MDKRGELTTQQIVILIILIISVVIILYFLFRLNFGATSEKEICHNSVIMKGNTPLSDEVSLNCQRTYVCLTKDGTCESMTNPDLKKVNSLPEIYEILADEMADCWWMFGEGQVNYVGKDFKENLYCSICSQIAFDDSVSKIEGIGENLDEGNFYKYMEENEISKGQTYLNYLLGLNSIEQLEETLSQEGGGFGTFEFDKQYFVMTGIYSEVGVWKWVAGFAAAGAVVGGIAASVFTGGTSAVGGIVTAKAILFGAVSAGAVGGGFAGKYLGTAVSGDGVDNDFLSPVILEANSEEFSAFNCKDILSLA